MTDAPPDRLSTDPQSPYYDADVLARNVGVRFRGEDKTNVDEYCVSEGWVRLVRAYAVLGDTRKRDAAYASARARYAGQPQVVQQLDEAARAAPQGSTE